MLPSAVPRTPGPWGLPSAGLADAVPRSGAVEPDACPVRPEAHEGDAVCVLLRLLCYGLGGRFPGFDRRFCRVSACASTGASAVSAGPHRRHVEQGELVKRVVAFKRATRPPVCSVIMCFCFLCNVEEDEERRLTPDDGDAIC